ncbi:MAG: hypothetical protein ACYTF8_07175, partial [Planctomycetota bacterium]
MLGVARGQDKPPAAAPTTVKVPAGTAPRIDGAVSDEEWKDGVPFEVRLDKEVFAKGRIKRAARQLFISCESEYSPWALGFRFNFTDPVSQRSNPVLVTPIHPPLPPVSAFRRVQGREPEPLSCASCDVRFSFPATGGVAIELRIPMDLVELSRSDKAYAFSIEMWDLEARRTMALFPQQTAGIGRATTMARLEPTDTWGADVES